MSCSDILIPSRYNKFIPCNHGFSGNSITFKFDEECDELMLDKLRQNPLNYISVYQDGDYIVFKLLNGDLRIKGRIIINK